MIDAVNQPSHEPTPYPDDTLGRFWLAGDDPAGALAGHIHVDEGGATVQLEGSLGGRYGIQDAVVFGRTPTGERLTLYNAFTTSSRLSAEGASSSVIESTMAVYGLHAVDLVARAVAFRLPYCAQWFREDTFVVEWSGDASTVVRFDDVREWTYGLQGGFSLTRRYNAVVPEGNWGSERLVIDRPMSFFLAAPGDAAVPFDVLWEQMRRVQRFFEFASRNHMPPTHIAIRPDGGGTGQRHVRVFVRFGGTARKVASFDDQLPVYPELPADLPLLLMAWGALFDEAPDVPARYFAAFDRDGQDAELHFLWNAVAVEELHKVRTGDRKRPDFLGRLTETAGRWAPLTGQAPPDDVLRQMKDTRHYHAHGAGDLREKAAKDWVLLRHGYYLETLATLEMLHRLGLGTDEVIDVARRRYWLRGNLALERFPTGPGS
ncbi:hypothetical protein KPL74_09025 [Bacillus sp. NP157]|nr:hypothetical protein KPL74_09025 [Bacillus sp. NP157]